MTVICPLADSYISAAARDAGAVAELAASRKEVKYAGLDGRYMFAFENLGVPSDSTSQLLLNLGRRLTDISGESRETSYLFPRCSVLVQRFGHDSLPNRDCTHYYTYPTFCRFFFLIFKPPSGSWLPRVKKIITRTIFFIVLSS